MFCPKCGEIVRNTAFKCPCCGASLRRDTTKVNSKCDHRHSQPDTVERGFGGWQNPAQWDQPRSRRQTGGASWVRAFWESLRSCFRFKGRTSRPDFLRAMAVYLGIFLIAALLDLLPGLWALLCFVPVLSLCVRRLRDAGVNAKFLFAVLIPWLGVPLLIVALLKPSAYAN